MTTNTSDNNPPAIRNQDAHLGEDSLPPRDDTPSEDDASQSSDAAPSFDKRRRRAPDRVSPTKTAANVWQHFAEQRHEATKVAKLDVGYHRPTMEQLAPVLLLAEKPSVSGRELFLAFESTLPSPPRPIVTYMQMDAGFFLNQIDEGRALRAVLHDHSNEGIDDGLADIVQLTIDTNSRQLIWGLASLTAAAILENKTFKIPTKDGHQSFTMQSKNILDGFFIDILGFTVDREGKAHLWEVLHAAGATPISGVYTHTSAAFGTTGSRYRLTFKTDEIPAIFKANGRQIDEIILFGKCYRVYGKDWYNHRKPPQRLDIDILSREKKITLPKAPTQGRSNSNDTGNGKRQRIVPDEELPWELVTKGATLNDTDTPLPWTSPNMYQALDDRVLVSSKQVTTAKGSDMTILPVIFERPDAPTSCQTTLRVKVSLNTTLDELAALDAAVAEAQATFEATCAAAASRTKLNLVQYVEAGEADWIQRDLEDHTIVFRRQLQDMTQTSPHLLLPLVQLRLLNRWMRTSKGSSTPFPQMCADTFAHRFSLATLNSDFTTVVTSTRLEESACPHAEDNTPTTHVEVEIILALAEMFLGSTAPMIYSSDALLYALTAQPVFSIPSRYQSRYLSSATLRSTLWGTTMLGATIWESLRATLSKAAEITQTKEPNDTTTHSVDASSTFSRWLAVMHAMEMSEESEALNVEPTNQVMLDPSTGRLTHVDLTELWTDPTALEQD
ncbi:hypothetical protein AC1031_000196 [Aphanomyces cochlioides]|nr:hypothetical protein AC1031_000196 [Aphanomyces cochlioides]